MVKETSYPIIPAENRSGNQIIQLDPVGTDQVNYPSRVTLLPLTDLKTLNTHTHTKSVARRPHCPKSIFFSKFDPWAFYFNFICSAIQFHHAPPYFAQITFLPLISLLFKI